MELWMKHRIGLELSSISIDYFERKEFVYDSNEFSKNGYRIQNEFDESRDDHERKEDFVRNQPNPTPFIVSLQKSKW